MSISKLLLSSCLHGHSAVSLNYCVAIIMSISKLLLSNCLHGHSAVS